MVFGQSSDKTEALYQEVKPAGLEFIPMEIRHLGTENCVPLLKKIRNALEKKVDVLFNTPVKEILVENGKVMGVLLENGTRVNADYVICGPGRVGAQWIKNEVQRLGIPSMPSPVDIGVRVEAPAPILQKLTDIAYEAKFIYYSKTFDDKVRTFCMNPFGEVVTETIDEIVTVNGHSYANKRTENTNFAILVSNTFTEPFNDPIGYGKYIARLANFLGNGVIIQRLGDLLDGRRSTPDRINRCITQPTLISATPGDLSFVLPYRHLKSIIEMLEALDRITPGIFSRHTLLYGVEVKFYTNRVKISPALETDIKNLFLIGDGAGITRGLMQASISGILAGDEILKRTSADRLIRLGKVPDCLKHLFVQTDVFRCPSTRDHQGIISFWLDFIKRCVQRKVVARLLAVCLIPLKIMDRRPNPFTSFLSSTNGMNSVPDHQQCLKRNHDFIILHKIPNDHQNLLRSHI